MQISKLLGALVLAMAIAACEVPELGPNNKAIATSEEAYALLVQNKREAFLAMLPEEFRGDDQRKLFSELYDLAPEGQGEPAKLVGWKNYAGTNGQTAQLALRYDYDGAHVAIRTSFFCAKGTEPWSLHGFHISPAQSDMLAAPAIGKPGAAPPLKRSSRAPANETSSVSSPG